MKLLFVACKMIAKRLWANALLIVEMLVSIILLAQLFVFVMDHVDHRRAVNELPTEGAAILAVYEYYYDEMDVVLERLRQEPAISAIDPVHMGTVTYGDAHFNLAAYSDAMIAHYRPALQAGTWLPGNRAAAGEGIPAVVSADVGLRVGDSARVRLPNQTDADIAVVGILQEPTQYLFPSGGAGSSMFAADMIIAQSGVILLQSGDLANTAFPTGSSKWENYFLFLQPDVTPDDALFAPWRKYGEITPMTSLVAAYSKNATEMISGGVVLFAAFFFLAATCIFSNQVIQRVRNQRRFTVYYLAGIGWKTAALMEGLRIAVLMGITAALSVAAGNAGLLMMEWMTPARIRLFYGLNLCYILLMFVGISAGFLRKLVRTDISVALKDLQQGE
ncbi:MAG: hypothetical protein LBM74_05355 [Oscillospiraceae bacterium]|jgi:hypothetical protein|nr:hypothetical protein [Oscillospiraceae bacterium]